MCSDPGQSLIREKIAARTARRRRRRLLLAAHAPEDLPQGGRARRASIPTWSRWPTSASIAPGSITTATQATAKAIDLIRMSVAKVRSNQALRADPRPGHAPGAGDRRRRGRHPGRAGYRRRRLRGRPGRARAVDRRQDGRPLRDLPHARLLAVHPHAADGRRRPASATSRCTPTPRSKRSRATSATSR